MDTLDKIKEEIAEFKKKKAILIEELRGKFFGVLKPVFDAHPTLKSIAWRQYTPAWCDGDTCYFSPNFYDIWINGINADYDIHTIFTEEEEGIEEDLRLAGVDKMSKNRLETIPSDLYEDLFGDGYTVTVHADGSITKEDYEED